MSKAIVIFKNDLTLQCFLYHANNILDYDFFDDTKKEGIQEIIDKVLREKDGALNLKVIFPGDNGYIPHGTILIKPSDERYIDALVEELTARGIIAHLIPAETVPVMKSVERSGISVADRKKIIGNIINFDGKTAEEFNKFIKEIRGDIEKLTQTDEEWRNYLENEKAHSGDIRAL
ncbi:MAG: hypothetical protein HZA94_00010 [Candidatus Vogelbacteria bacterium]|nr:hypothetical protein [Candidatus Vogelbacteria bacterium]